MPKYIAITPQFNPITLDEYLKVPTMVYTEQQKELDKLEDYKDKLSYYKALMGDSDEAKQIFTGYDDIVTQMTDELNNYTVSDLQGLGRRARSAFRDIGSKIEVAVQKRAEQQSRKDKDPTNVGEVGSLLTYYENPDYTPVFTSGKDLSTRIGNVAKALAQALPYNVEGYVDPAKSKMSISQGYSVDQLNTAYLEAISLNTTPTTSLGQALRQELNASGYFNLNAATQRELQNSIQEGLQSGAKQYSVMANPEYLTPAQRESLQASRAARQDASDQRRRDKASGMKGAQEIKGNDGNTYYYIFNGDSLRIVNSEGAPVTSFTDEAGNTYPYSGVPGIFKISKSDKDTNTSSIIPGVKSKPSGKKVIDSGVLAADTSTVLKDEQVTELINDIQTGSAQEIAYADLTSRQKHAIDKTYPKLKDDQEHYIIVQDSRKNFRVLYMPDISTSETVEITGESTVSAPESATNRYSGTNVGL